MTAVAESKIAPRDHSARAVMLETEVRQLLRGMSADARGQAIERALNDGDERWLNAALNAPPELIGLSRNLAEVYRRRWLRQVASAQLDAIAAIEKAAEAIDAAGGRLLNRFSQAFDHEALNQAENRGRAARQAEAGVAA